MNYVNARTVEEALDALKLANGTGRILAGGTDFMLDLEQGKFNCETIVDITGVPEMSGITLEDDYLVIGSAVTLDTIAKDSLVKEYFPSLAKGCNVIGSRQIRNIATLGGNVTTAQPAADGGIALACFDPEFVVVDHGGERRLKVEEMYVGFGKSAVDPTFQILTKIRVPIPDKKSEAASFVRLELRKSLSLPMLNVSAKIRMGDGIIESARIHMAPVGVGPVRAIEAEEFLTGKKLDKDSIAEAALLALKNANPRSNPLRGSREYREQTLPVLVKRALEDIAVQLGIEI
ncbi:MAG: FAD binding domain-containing protein [Clostridiaceae bacterium]